LEEGRAEHGGGVQKSALLCERQHVLGYAWTRQADAATEAVTGEGSGLPGASVVAPNA